MLRVKDAWWQTWYTMRDVWRRRWEAVVAYHHALEEQKRVAEEANDWWEPLVPGACWVCGDDAPLAYLDLGYQHMDCDWWPLPPDENGNVSSIKIVRGERVDDVA